MIEESRLDELKAVEGISVDVINDKTINIVADDGYTILLLNRSYSNYWAFEQSSKPFKSYHFTLRNIVNQILNPRIVKLDTKTK